MKKIFLLLFVTILSTAIYAQNTETQYYRYQSEINGLCVNYPEGMFGFIFCPL
ncbi:MAG: hypothetical protein MJ211_15810 [Bacteroidales bacterium]|nr:hypothetical protein [Bacteroidales bacterium]